MPPRRRSSRANANTVAESPVTLIPLAAAPTSREGTPTGPRTRTARQAALHVAQAQTGISSEPAYRTRHRRAIRGPDVAEREGGSQDLIPPSDDEEFDTWRAIRAVERTEAGSRQRQADVDKENNGAPVAGPSRRPRKPSPSLAISSFGGGFTTLPLASPLFVPLFDDGEWSSGSMSDEDWVAVAPRVTRKGKRKTVGSLPVTRKTLSQESSRGTSSGHISEAPRSTTSTNKFDGRYRIYLSPDTAPSSAGQSPVKNGSQRIPLPLNTSENEHQPDLGNESQAIPRSLEQLLKNVSESPQLMPTPLPGSPMEIDPPDPPGLSDAFDTDNIITGEPGIPDETGSPPMLVKAFDDDGHVDIEPGSHPPPSVPRLAPQDGHLFLSQQAASRLPSISGTPLVVPPVVVEQPAAVPPPPSPPDAALLHFRTARTFRTRTALQLQPYTRERQMYETALRRGGLANGRRAVASPSDVREAVKAGEDDAADGADSSGSSSASGDEETTPPDAIVIGNTPPEKPPRPPREPKPLADVDFDEYFVQFGEVADEDDAVAQRRLQKIARERLRAEKDARRKAREAERTRKQFEALMARQANEQRALERIRQMEAKESSKSKENSGQNVTKAAPRIRQRRETDKGVRVTSTTDGTSYKTPRTKTYSRRQHFHPQPLSSDGELSDAPALEMPSEAGQELVAPISPLSPQQPLDAVSPLASHSHDYEPVPFDDFGMGIFDHDSADLDDEHGQQASNGLGESSESIRRHVIRDAHSSTKRRRVLSSSSASPEQVTSEEESDREESVEDKRQRIARRMLPAAMLKRLEREEADRIRKQSDARRRQHRVETESPVRRGHAVVRRRLAGSPDPMADLFEDDSNDGEDAGTFDHPIVLEAEVGGLSDAGSSAADPDDGVIVLSDDSSDSGYSEAVEDGGVTEGLALLRRGDFETIVRGRPRTPGNKRAAIANDPERPKKRKARRRVRRPPLGLAKRVPTSSTAARFERLVQAHLDFPVVDKAGEQRARKMKKTNSGHKGPSDKTRPRPGRTSNRSEMRPAIRLDDRTIFATTDFAFESEPERSQPKVQLARVSIRTNSGPIQTPGRARHRSESRLASPAIASPVSPISGRVVTSPSPAPHGSIAHLDEGVGKARSWANFESFPVDFNITPLPWGVFLSSDTLPGSGRLSGLLSALSGGPPDEELKPVRAYDVDLHQAMSIDEAVAIIPIVLDGLYDALVAYANSSSSNKPNFTPLEFFRDYLLRADADTKATLHPHFISFGARLGEINMSGRGEDRPALEQLLLARYSLLELASVAGPTSVVQEATTLIKLLLTYGFDRTIKPLKRILRGDSETPEITDLTVGVWISICHILWSHDQRGDRSDSLATALCDAVQQRFLNEVGPLAAERIWFLIFGLCAISQFGVDGRVTPEYSAYPRWILVKRALGLIKVTHSQEAEERAQLHQLQGRDRYIKAIVARCLRLSSTWRWSFDRSSFSVATRDLGMVFKDRQHRNLPSEPPVDFPDFIARFDISLTAEDNTRHASAFELYLRLACVAASDLISAAEALEEAKQAERDVQRLIMSIFPLSAVPFTRATPPTPRQLGALINRYSTMVVACYFSPSLLPWLLANSQRWLAFDKADVSSRQVCIRGLMYLAVACRHHGQALDTVVGRLADILGTLKSELEAVGRPSNPAFFPSKLEIERTMVVVVSCFRQIILHPGYTERPDPVYPDPMLLNECWTKRIFELDLAKDVKAGVEIVSTIQAFLDARSAALPNRAKRARESRVQDSLDDYPSLGFDFDAVDLAALGGDEAVPVDHIEVMDSEFANIILNVICPKIYRLLSDMLPPVVESVTTDEKTERQKFINKLTKCWADCAGIVVVEHNLTDWSSYVGPFGQQSWSRIGNEFGRIQVGLHFMSNVATIDPGAFRTYEEDFISLLFQTIVTDRLTIEHKYASAVFSMPGALDHALFEGLLSTVPEVQNFDRTTFMDKREQVLELIFSNVPSLLRSRFTPAAMKTLIYRCINLLVSSLVTYESAIPGPRVLHRESFRDFATRIVTSLRRAAGEFVNPSTVPTLRSINWTSYEA